MNIKIVLSQFLSFKANSQRLQSIETDLKCKDFVNKNAECYKFAETKSNRSQTFHSFRVKFRHIEAKKKLL